MIVFFAWIFGAVASTRGERFMEPEERAKRQTWRTSIATASELHLVPSTLGVEVRVVR